jgi:hypothetical protein
VIPAPLLAKQKTFTAKGAEHAESGGEGEGVGSDVVSCVEIGRSLLLGKIRPCKKQGLTPDFEGESGTRKNREGTEIGMFNHSMIQSLNLSSLLFRHFPRMINE